MAKKIKIFFITVIIASAAAGSAFLFLKNRGERPLSGNSSGLIAGTNAIYVSEQEPSRTVLITAALLEKPGFAAVYEDDDGTPGKVIGTSELIGAGETKNIKIYLSRQTTDGEILYAMLHLDDGDGKFDAGEDKPPEDKLSGEYVMTIFSVNEGAQEPDDAEL